MDSRQAFLDAIAANRYDQALRWAYSDWLEEHGYDDEAAEQRRWTPERQEAEDWLRAFAQRCGRTCVNYDEACDDSRRRWNAWEAAGRPGDYPALDESIAVYKEITYEMVLEAGHNYLRTGDYFVQMGSETARDLMHGETQKLYWKHWQTITCTKIGEDVDLRYAAPFTCSC